MDIFLDTYKIPKLTQEYTNILKNPIKSNKIDTVIIYQLIKARPDGFTTKYYKTFKN